MKILKFGGKSLDFALDNVIEIIKKATLTDRIIVVVSAIGNTTDELSAILSLAKNQDSGYQERFGNLKSRNYYQEPGFSGLFKRLSQIYEGVNLLGDYDLKIKDQVLAFGELLSAQIIAHALNEKGIPARPVDSRLFLTTDQNFGNAVIKIPESRTRTQSYFGEFPQDVLPVVTGFIAQSESGATTTLGRNGSNYSASLLANFLDADELQNYTHVNGLFTANPDWVKEARKIVSLSFEDANELAVLGASVLHAKTIVPLIEKEIPLRILNTLKPEEAGTLISAHPDQDGIKAISTHSEVALIQLEGRGLLSTVGIDARAFSAIAAAGISVGLIAQGSSERGVGFVVKESEAATTLLVLKEAFQPDIYRGDVHRIFIRKDVAVVSIVGMDLGDFDKAYKSLVKNQIIPLLFNNAVTGKNISLVVHQSEMKKAVNTIHGHIVGIPQKINLAIFGIGNVGGTLIHQLLSAKKKIEERKKISLNIFAASNSTQILFNAEGLTIGWEEDFKNTGEAYTIQSVIDFARENSLENLIAVDNTSSREFVNNYIPLAEAGFDLVSSNKMANTMTYAFYRQLRQVLHQNHKEYLYETNVGAGLPLIDNLKLLHLSGENITRIRGVFSGSLSFLFNKFSIADQNFGSVLREAMDSGLTEPDPREDLSGNDVGRKLLILARELDLQNEFEEIKIQNLIPVSLREMNKPDFLNNLDRLDDYFNAVKRELPDGFVLRYVGELSGDLQKEKGIMETKLIPVPVQSLMGQLKGSDSLFEIYTESYGEKPIVIQGAGAGSAVTARGVFGDILRIINKGV